MTCRLPSETSTEAVQKRRGIVPEVHGSQAISRIWSNHTILSDEFQKSLSLLANRDMILSSGPPSVHSGT